jgi:hypothetical protein
MKIDKTTSHRWLIHHPVAKETRSPRHHIAAADR